MLDSRLNGVPSDGDLRTRLTLTEDQFTERKSSTDEGGWLKTVVAFANSTPVGYPAFLFVGVNNSGVIQPDLKIEALLKKFSNVISSKTWPPIYTLPKTLSQGGMECLAVIVPGSDLRPHFAGRAYVRVGTETQDGSEEQFSELISHHVSKAREILRWKGHSIMRLQMMPVDLRQMYSEQKLPDAVIVSCNPHYVIVTVPVGNAADQQTLA